MKNSYRFVDCDMHIMEHHDVFERYMDPKLKSRITTSPKRTSGYVRPRWLIDGVPISNNDWVTQYNRSFEATTRARSEHILSFAIEGNYDEEAQNLGMEMEGVDIAVLFPKGRCGGRKTQGAATDCPRGRTSG